MVHEHLATHRLDRRLLRRRKWLSAEELAKELKGLPDVSDKIRPPEPEEEAAEAAEPPREG